MNNDKMTINLVGNAHIDMIYRWRLNETLERVTPETFSGVLDVMDGESELTYAQSQFALYEEVERRRPDLFRRILEKIQNGTWCVVGGKYVESDSMLPGGEALIRQFLVGQRYARDHLGIDRIRVAWIPDCFAGHANTTPQIYRGCGIDYYVFNRGCPENLRVFRWRSPDGTEVFAYKIPKHYNLTISEELADAVDEWSKISGHPEAMVLYGEGDHGGGPRQGDVDGIHRLMKSPEFPAVRYDTPEAILDRTFAEGTDWPTFEGEMGVDPASGHHRGAHTSQARLKRWNRYLEHALSVAECIATIGAMNQRKNFYPRHDLRNMWKMLLLHQFHDTLPGTLIGDAVDDVMRDYKALEEETRRTVRFGLEVLGSRIDTRGEGVPLLVFNPSPWRRSGVVTATIRTFEQIDPSRLAIQDRADGTSVAFSVCSQYEEQQEFFTVLELFAKDLPATGYRMYGVKQDAEPSGQQSTDLVFTESAGTVENSFYRAGWDATGIVSVYDKVRSRELLSGTGNLLQLLEESQSSSWHVRLSGESRSIRSVSGPRVVRNTPTEFRVRWTDGTNQSRFIRDLVLRPESPMVEFDLQVDWYDKDALLKVAFPFKAGGTRTVYESPYGVIERDDDGSEAPCQNWLSHSDGTFGIGLLNNGTYSFDAEQDQIRLSVVRGARDMDPRMDEGRHYVRYALIGHEGTWKDADLFRQSMDFNRPLEALQETPHVGTLPNWGDNRNDFSLPADLSFFSVDVEHVIVSAVKVVEDDWNPAHVVLRLFESIGTPGPVTVTVPTTIGKVIETDHIEDTLSSQPKLTVEANTFRLEMGAHQIRTFRVEFASGAEGG